MPEFQYVARDAAGRQSIGTVVATDPEQARAFVRDTGVDYIAVSIGNTPGQTTGEAPIDVPLLGVIAAAAEVPIVMHGGTSVPDATMREAMALGVAKVNIDTAIRLAMTEALTAYYRTDPVNPDPRVSLGYARDAAQAAVAAKIALFGATGKAG